MADQADRIIEKLVERTGRGSGGKARCPLCRQGEFNVDGLHVKLPIEERPGHHYPCVAIVCTNCGNTQLVNIHILGLVDR